MISCFPQFSATYYFNYYYHVFSSRLKFTLYDNKILTGMLSNDITFQKYKYSFFAHR